MKYYVIAGEKSGDLHAANLLREIRKLDAKAQFRGFGGDDMQVQGMEIVKHYRDLAFMGFLEVAKNIRTIYKNIELCQNDIMAFQPDAIVLVDYPGFNLKIAEFAKKQGLKVFYYISPKIWAWNTKRALKIKRFVDKMFVIFPFEVNFYKQFDYNVEFVGNPLLDAISNYKADPGFLTKNQLSNKPVISLLPGSRRQELEKILPEMASVISRFPDYQFVIAGVSDFSEDFYYQILQKAGLSEKPKIIFDQTYDLLSHSTASLVTSGTATLETGLFEIPQVVCYKTSAITYAIAKNLIKVPYISLVNLVGEKKIVTELIQQHLNTQEISEELKKLLPSAPERQIQLNDYKILKERLSITGASETTAKLIVSNI